MGNGTELVFLKKFSDKKLFEIEKKTSSLDRWNILEEEIIETWEQNLNSLCFLGDTKSLKHSLVKSQIPQLGLFGFNRKRWDKDKIKFSSVSEEILFSDKLRCMRQSYHFSDREESNNPINFYVKFYNSTYSNHTKSYLKYDDSDIIINIPLKEREFDNIKNIREENYTFKLILGFVHGFYNKKSNDNHHYVMSSFDYNKIKRLPKKDDFFGETFSHLGPILEFYMEIKKNEN